MRFYTGTMFPARYRGGVILAEHGSWNRTTKLGYRVMVVPLDDAGRPEGYEPLVGGFVTGDEVANGKPAPDIFIEAARRIGCDPKKCIVFEDSPSGIAGAHAAGCLAVALPDARMPSNAGRFTELAPRWSLAEGIGAFDPSQITRLPPSQRGAAGLVTPN